MGWSLFCGPFVLFLVGKLLCAEEKHMLTEVGKARQFGRVAHVANVHVHGRCGLVCCAVGD